MSGPGRLRTAAPVLFVLGASLGSILPGWAHVPILLYAPVERSLRVAAVGAPGGPAIEITYYGTYLCAGVFGGLGCLLGLAWDRSARAMHPLLPAWTLTALALAASYQLWSVWP